MEATSSVTTDNSLEQLYAEARKRPPLSEEELAIVLGASDLGITRDTYTKYKQCAANLIGNDWDTFNRGLVECRKTAISEARPLFSWAGYEDRKDYIETREDSSDWITRTYRNGARMRYTERGGRVWRRWVKTPPPPPFPSVILFLPSLNPYG